MMKLLRRVIRSNMSFVSGCIIFSLLISKCLAGFNTLQALYKVTRPLVNQVDNITSFIETAAQDGYRAEEHEVTTEDGYILTIHRLLAEPSCIKKRPVLLMHGVLQASQGFIDIGQESPGYVFSKKCYDVWLGNVRGNFNSRKHEKLNPDRDLKFWKFSVDEMGKYDIPAMIDYVLDKTNSKKLIYVGYSQGGGTFIIMNSEKPEYAAKVSLFVGLAPSTRNLHSKGLGFRTGTQSINIIRPKLEAAGIWEILRKGLPASALGSTLCGFETLGLACSALTFALDSPDPKSLPPAYVKAIYRHFPAGTSVQNVAHYGQATVNEYFTKFDFGPEENLKVYGRENPPYYNFNAVQVPTVIFSGASDEIVDTKDVEWAVNQLPHVLEFITVKDPQWNHLDMAYSRYWKDKIFVPMLKYLNRIEE